MSINSMTNAAIVRRSGNKFGAPNGQNGTARDIDDRPEAGSRHRDDGSYAPPANSSLDVLFRYIPTEILTVYLAGVAALQPTAPAASLVTAVCHSFKGSAAIAMALRGGNRYLV